MSLDDAPAPKVIRRDLPGCTVLDCLSVGLSADKKSVVMICNTQEQGEIAIIVPIDKVAPFAFAAEAARRSANSMLPEDQQQVPATVITTFEVGRTSDVNGILFMANPKTANEQFSVMSDDVARAAGNALVGAAFKPKPTTVIHNRLRGRILDAMGRPVDFTKKH